MNKKIRIGPRQTLTLTDKLYKAAGGEASIFTHGDRAIKIYHDESKTLSPAKISELGAIRNPSVITPQDIVFDAATGHPIGYATRFIDHAEPLVKLVTRTFKDQNSIDNKMIIELVKQMQLITKDIHAAKCLIVDYNELNILAQISSSIIPFYIDTDSYATPSFKATAIMDSVRDRRVSKIVGGHVHYHPDELSDWFSWGVLAFWIYSNIHPFRGSHPKYGPKDKMKQMDDGISVFHKDIRMPPSVNNFNIIPQRHLDWFKDTFLNNNRSVPPFADSAAPVAVPAAIVIVHGTKAIDVEEIAAYPEAVVGVFYNFGMDYAITKNHVYFKDNEIISFNGGIFKKVLLCTSVDNTLVGALFGGGKVHFLKGNTHEAVGSINSTGVFARNGAIYTVTNNKLIENTFTTIGNKLIHRVAELENVSDNSVIFDGCIIQDLLGHKYLTLPYAKGRCFSKPLSCLDGHRVIEAKSEKHITVILTEKGGKYHRFVLILNNDLFDIREVNDVAYDTINFTVAENGICLLLSSPTELELFATNQKIEIIDSPPFDSTMRLFSSPNGIFFINNNSIHKIKKK